MEKKYYKIASKGYLTTMAVRNVYLNEARHTGVLPNEVYFLEDRLSLHYS